MRAVRPCGAKVSNPETENLLREEFITAAKSELGTSADGLAPPEPAAHRLVYRNLEVIALRASVAQCRAADAPSTAPTNSRSTRPASSP